MNSPLSIPFLAHSTFNQLTSRWLRDQILRHKDLAIPLHLPTAKLREAAFPTIRQLTIIIGERKNVDDRPCCCDWIRQRSTNLGSTTGHMASAFEDLSVPSHLRMFHSANANSTYIFTADNQILNFLFNEPCLGHNNMDCHLLQMMTSNVSLTNNGPYIPENWQRILAFLFRRSSIFNNGSQKKPFFIMQIMNMQS